MIGGPLVLTSVRRIARVQISTLNILIQHRIECVQAESKSSNINCIRNLGLGVLGGGKLETWGLSQRLDDGRKALVEADEDHM